MKINSRAKLLLLLMTLSTTGLTASEPELSTDSPRFFERLDTDNDGKLSVSEAPADGKMLVEFLLSRTGKKISDELTRAEFFDLPMRLDSQPDRRAVNDKAVAAALAGGEVQPAPDNCPACAMGLTAEFVFKRLDLNEDRQVTVAEFRRSPGMDDEGKAREVVGRLDQSGDGKLSWDELKTAYDTRHANCTKPDSATLAASAGQVRADGRGDGNRFARVFILRSDQNGDGKIDPSEFRGGATGLERLDKNKNGFIGVDELGELHQQRLNDPKSMQQRLQEGDLKRPPHDKRPPALDAKDQRE